MSLINWKVQAKANLASFHGKHLQIAISAPHEAPLREQAFLASDGRHIIELLV